MNFIEAVKFAKIGKKIRNSNWDKGYYIWMQSDYFFNPSNEKYFPNLNSILETNWDIYEEKLEMYTFREAFEAYEKGKRIRREDKNYYLSSLLILNNKPIFSYEDILATNWMIEED